MRRRSPRVPFEEWHSRKRVPATTPRLFALRFEPANQNCACPELPHHEVTATAHLKVKATKRRMRDDVSKDRKRCAPSSALRWCRPASLALEIVN